MPRRETGPLLGMQHREAGSAPEHQARTKSRANENRLVGRQHSNGTLPKHSRNSSTARTRVDPAQCISINSHCSIQLTVSGVMTSWLVPINRFMYSNITSASFSNSSTYTVSPSATAELGVAGHTGKETGAEDAETDRGQWAQGRARATAQIRTGETVSALTETLQRNHW